MKMIWSALIVVVLALLYSCATASKTYDQQGDVYNISCSDMAMSACYDKARETCPEGYQLAGKDTGGGAIGALNSSGDVTKGTYASGRNKDIIIKCK